MIGPGLVPHPRIDRELLGLTIEQADAWQKQAARLWWKHAGGVGFDIRRRSTFAKLSWLVARGWLESGDVFYRRRYLQRQGDLLGLKVQLIEADRISNPNRAPDTPGLIEGVEMDDDGAPVAFHVSNHHPGDPLQLGFPLWTRQPAFSAENGLPLMRQVSLLERDGQTRGVSIFAPVIESLKQLTRFAGAELDTTVAASFIMAIFTSDDRTGMGSMGTGQPDVGIVTGSAATASADKQIEMAPAAIPHLLPGESLEPFNPVRPQSAFDSFFRAFCSMIGVAVGLPHELLIKHFTSSYSASRGALLEAWRGFKAKRSLVLVDEWAQPVWEWFIYESVARGYLTAPRFFEDPLVAWAYCECSWSGPLMGQLNPAQEIAAAKMAVDTGFTTLEEQTAELTGGDDWERKNEQRVREHKLRVEGGLEPQILNVTTRAAVPEPGDPTAAPVNEDDSAPDSADEAETDETDANNPQNGRQPA